MRILSVQSSVAYGYVGNTAATFPLQRLGHEVWPVLTVHFSNHTEYETSRGLVIEPAVVQQVIDGIAERGVLGSVDAVLTGYQGSPGVAEVVLRTVARVRAANPAAVYCCDPVMGDTDVGMYVLPGLPQLIRDSVVPVADIVTPNAYELAYLAGPGGDPDIAARADVSTVDAVLAAIDVVRATGPGTVLVTSIEQAGVSEDEIGMIAVDDSGAYLIRTPRLPLVAKGTGDVTAALFLAHLPAGIELALARVASSVFAILAATVQAGSREIRLVQAQDAIADPPEEFAVTRLA